MLAAVLVGCTGAGSNRASVPADAPSIGEARSHLASLVAIVRTGDLTTLCALGSGTCEHMLAGSDPTARPTSDPLVIGSRLIDATASSPAGRILALRGRDGNGDPYVSEILVFRDGDRLISTGTVYWLGTRIAVSP